METLHYLLGQHMDAQFVARGLGPQLNLGKNLVGEGVAHHKAGMSMGTPKVHQATLSQQDNVTSTLHCESVNQGLTFLFV